MAIDIHDMTRYRPRTRSGERVRAAFMVQAWGSGFGGTERYTSELADALRPHGIDAIRHDIDTDDLRDSRPQLACIHVWSRSAARAAVLAAEEAGVPSVLTWHVAALACPNETLMHRGRQVCDGRLDAKRCAACVVATRAPVGMGGLASRSAGLARHLPRGMTRVLPRPIRSACRLSGDVADAVQDTCGWLSKVGRFHVFSRHSRDTLLANGIDPDRIRLIRHAVNVCPEPRPVRGAGEPIRFGYAGRAHRAKGLGILLEAIGRIGSEVRAEFHLFGAADVQLADNDKKVRTHDAYRAGEQAAVLAGVDVMIVPSTGVETGPLVSLEAMAVGVPVVGSDLPGLSEQIRDGVDGLLFPPGDARALARTICRLASDRDLLGRLQKAVPPVPRMADHAEAVAAMYRGLMPAEGRADAA